jgi:ubiquinone/menaquinone biosynthesis C-methylase UbiE
MSSLLDSSAFALGADGIYSAPAVSFASDQETERTLRERVAAEQQVDYLSTIADNHSIPVMDYEVDRFLALMPAGALILDIGGCWGWHWRRLARTRPDVGVLIVDFVRSNLRHAQEVLGSLVGSQVALLHADATALPFSDANSSLRGFDGVWTVQVFQHIPDFALACREAHRVLAPGGRFVNYSLHSTPFNRVVYRLFGKAFHTEGMFGNAFHLTRANDHQRSIVAQIFEGDPRDRYTECLFHPDLRLLFTGERRSWVGKIDASLGNMAWLGKWIARQRSFEARKV